MTAAATTAATADTPQAVDELLARCLRLRHDDVPKAAALARQAHAMSLRIDYQRGLAYSLLRVALCEHMLRIEHAKVDRHLQQSIQMMRSLGDRSGEAEALNLFGNLRSHRLEHDAAIEAHRQSLALRRAIGDRPGEAASLYNLSLVLRRQSQWSDALDLLLQSLEVATGCGSEQSMAYAELGVGGTLCALGDPGDAVEHFHRCLAHAAQTDDRAIECTAHIGLAESLARMERHHEALASLNAAIGCAERTGNAGDLTEARIAIGRQRLRMGQHDLARHDLANALFAIRRDGDRDREAGAVCALAGCHLQAGDPTLAIALGHEALALARDHRHDRVVAECHRLLSQAHEARGELTKALLHYRSFHEAEQRTVGQAALKRAQALLARHEVARVEREAASQRLLNAALGRELDAVREAEREKSGLLAELAAQAEALEQLAREDGLTGVANRRWLDAQYVREFERARRFGHPLTVAMIDIDDFKTVNDQLGHAVGDDVLRTVARLLRDTCRMSDLVGRYGGEEFTLLLAETPLEPAAHLAEKLRLRVAQHAWTQLHARLPAVTVSIGLATMQLDQSPGALTGAADRALYLAKRAGKNCVRIGP